VTTTAAVLLTATACGGGASNDTSVTRDSGAAAAVGTSTGAAASTSGDARPASDSLFVDRGACPFECCHYGRWRVNAPTTLRAAADSSSAPVGTLARGALVRATGEVHVRPGLFVPRRPIPAYAREANPPAVVDTFRVGDTLGVFTYIGEGAWKLRRVGAAHAKGPLLEAMLATPGTGCDQRNECDGVMLRKPVSTWWAQIRTDEGLTGWTTDTKNFDGRDRCSGVVIPDSGPAV
jgi:hypothetical protein